MLPIIRCSPRHMLVFGPCVVVRVFELFLAMSHNCNSEARSYPWGYNILVIWLYMCLINLLSGDSPVRKRIEMFIW